MRVYVIAGEASGDILGAQVMASLRLLDKTVSFQGVGGPLMSKQGLDSLFPMVYLSVMGLVEIIPALPRVIKCLGEVVNHIRLTKPDLILTIDAPAFNYRVAKGVKRLGIPLFHITAPTVWAWRPSRAKAMAKLYDHLFCLFPFEPPYFEKEGLASTFIGHPLADMLQSYDQPYNPQGPFMLLPGSRNSELEVFLPLFRTLLDQNPSWIDRGVIIPTLSSTRPKVEEAFKAYKVTFVPEGDEKYSSMAGARLALAASGTVTLELGLLGIPMIVGYRVHPVSAWLLKRLVCTPFVTLVNILLNGAVVPELLQTNCRADIFAHTLQDTKALEAQRPYLARLKTILSAPHGKSSAFLVAHKIMQQQKG